MNTKLLRKVAKHIAEEPRRLEMEYMTTPLSKITPKDRPPCGTVACIAGWALILTKEARYANTNFPVDESGDEVCADAAENLLGISDGQKLFYVNDWPNPFRDLYVAAKTPRGRASAAAARIEHFIKTKGAE